MSDMPNNALPVPPQAYDTAEAKEAMRVWVVGEDAGVSIRADALDSPEAWGVLLCDIANHVSTQYEQLGEGMGADALLRLSGSMMHHLQKLLIALNEADEQTH